jgi:hypothetical protein
MTYPKRMRRKKAVTLSQVLPIWTASHAAAANGIFLGLLERIGITDVRSYFHKLRGLIVISVVVCACSGAANVGLKGFAIGGLLGLVAPLALLWAGVILTLAVIYLAIFAAAWAAIFGIAGWLLRQL